MWTALALLVLQDSQPASPSTTSPAPTSPAVTSPASRPAPSAEQVRHAGEIAGLAFSDAELELMRGGVAEQLASIEALRALPLANDVAPALRFTPPTDGYWDVQPEWIARHGMFSLEPLPRMNVLEIERPKQLDELAFASIAQLSALIRSRKVGCVELTEFFLARLKRLDPRLLAVITLTEGRALAQARMRDSELEHGIYRGYLHGIPYGAKDLLAVAGYPTTWGSRIYADRRVERDGAEETASVIEALDEAGAVLIAKLSLGELAMGDRWFGGMTRNPWKLEQGSSGSSAGSSAAVAAGCVAFAIGSETLGSIVSPSTRCGCSSIRPTFGLVDTRGAMALSWSMDKLGPICRSVEDAAIVLQVIAKDKQAKGRRQRLAGSTQRDPPAPPSLWQPKAVSFAGRRIGYVARAFEASKRDQRVLDELRALGAELVPIELPKYPVWDMMLILTAEAAASFDDLTRDGRDEQMVDQSKDGWPNVFRVARLIPATDYIRANRLRGELRREMQAVFERIDVIVHPSFGDMLGIGNLVGYPTVVAPSGFDDDGTPYSISFTGRLYDDTNVLDVARNWQLSTAHHTKHPVLD